MDEAEFSLAKASERGGDGAWAGCAENIFKADTEENTVKATETWVAGRESYDYEAGKAKDGASEEEEQ